MEARAFPKYLSCHPWWTSFPKGLQKKEEMTWHPEKVGMTWHQRARKTLEETKKNIRNPKKKNPYEKPLKKNETESFKKKKTENAYTSHPISFAPLRKAHTELFEVHHIVVVLVLKRSSLWAARGREKIGRGPLLVSEAVVFFLIFYLSFLFWFLGFVCVFCVFGFCFSFFIVLVSCCSLLWVLLALCVLFFL